MRLSVFVLGYPNARMNLCSVARNLGTSGIFFRVKDMPGLPLMMPARWIASTASAA